MGGSEEMLEHLNSEIITCENQSRWYESNKMSEGTHHWPTDCIMVYSLTVHHCEVVNVSKVPFIPPDIGLLVSEWCFSHC